MFLAENFITFLCSLLIFGVMKLPVWALVNTLNTTFYHGLANQHLILSATRVYGKPRSPLVKNRELSTVTLGVVEDIIINILSNHQKFTYEVRPPLDILSPGFQQKNGSWTGSAGQLQRREVDMCVTTVAPSYTKVSIMEISSPVVYVDVAILIPFPTEKSKIWIDSPIFQGSTWIAIGVCFVVTVGATWLIHRSTTLIKPNQSRNSLVYWIFFYISVWTTQGDIPRNPSTHFRIICAVSFLGIYVISNYFTAFYTSSLSIPVFKTTINSIQDLADSDTIKTLLIKGSSTEEFIMASTDPTYAKIGNQMREYPERRITNAFQVEDISTLVKDDFALVIIKTNGESLIKQSYNFNNKTCRVTSAEKTFLSRPQTYTYPKNSLLVAEMNMEILLLHQSGLIRYAERRAAISNNQRCSVSEIKKAKAGKIAPLTLGDMTAAFMVLGVGLIVGCLIFIIELIVAAINERLNSVKIISDELNTT